MRFVDDMGYPDIAGVLGKTVGAVRVIQFRALANLRHMMEDELSLHRYAPKGVSRNGASTNGHGSIQNGNGYHATGLDSSAYYQAAS
jgi:hypothetical protein